MMALPLGKLTILVGAGLVGSVLAQEGRLSTVSDFVSGAFKIVFKQIKQDDSGSSVSKPRNDTLLAQVNSLRQELQILTSNRPITIVTGTGSGTRKYGMIIVVVVVGYGYVWWKGWKLPDMMFATKRSLSDACNNVAKQLEDVYLSISTAQRQLSSKITTVDRDVDKIAEISQATHEEVTLLRGRSKLIGEEFESVRDVVQTLESKLTQIEGKQDMTTQGVKKLCDCVRRMENDKPTERIQASPYSFFRTTIEPPAITQSSRTGSLPPLPLEPPSPSNSNGSQKVEWPQQNAVSVFGLKEFNEVPEVGESLLSPMVSNGIRASEDSGNRSSSNGFLGRRFVASGASVLTRQRSATSSMAQAAVSGGLQC
ncbi:hypothetical protein ACOSP7_018730 [Xanthoceras sorbifolium]|uniref:DUF1664 domain-containing protein n=1 Tax=Xanthoceras sorbifolium TaxID=99658 RepID=A0ABQ8I219_9ROSI|nr:hypothetical protein JRO89_XS05G0126000 [Xanthoceras sorbifolium]